MTFLSGSSNSSAAVRGTICFLVVLLHIALILGPWFLQDMFGRRKIEKNAFRVKIGAAELSGGPEVGMPERKMPLPVPPAPEPKVPAPKVPKRVVEPRIPKVQPKPKPKTKPKPKVAPKPKLKPKTKPVKAPEPKLQPRKKAPKKVVKPQPKPPKPPKRKNPMDDVFQDNFPANMNPKVPVGSRNRSQKYAPKPDNKAPGGGAKADEAAWARWGKNVENYIYSRWVQPPQALLRGEFPSVVVEITIEANGRVTAAKVIQGSSNPAMAESVRVFLSQLDLLPRPPEGRTTFQVTLKTR